MLRAIFVAGCALLGCLTIRGQRIDRQPRATENWTVTGVVTDSATGLPVTGALVRWDLADEAGGFPILSEAGPPSESSPHAITSASGAFAIPVDARFTRARLFISHSGYQSEYPDGGGCPVSKDGALKSGDSVCHDLHNIAILTVTVVSPAIAVRLVPLSSLEGHVMDTKGGPLAGIEVNAYRIEIVGGRRVQPQVYSQVTGADGSFHFHDLRPGSYFLRAAGGAYGPAYYPEAFPRNPGQALRIQPGTTVDADFRLESHNTFRIKGVVTHLPSGRKWEVRLLGSGDDTMRFPVAVHTDGTFEVSGVAPGSYSLQAYTLPRRIAKPEGPGPSSSSRADLCAAPEPIDRLFKDDDACYVLPPAFGEVQLTVADHDLAGVTVPMSEGVSVSGRIVVPGNPTGRYVPRVIASPAHPSHLPWELPGSEGEPLHFGYQSSIGGHFDGRFVFHNVLPGKYIVEVFRPDERSSGVDGFPHVYVAEIGARSKTSVQDVLEQGLTITDRDPPTLSIVMKTGSAEVAAKIGGSKSGDHFGAWIVLVSPHGTTQIPIVREIWRSDLEVREFNDRSFLFTGLPPGDYTLSVWASTEELEYYDQAVLAGLVRHGSALHLGAGERRYFDLTRKPNP